MDDFKIIFYIAVAIAWAIYNNYKKVQKNRPKTSKPPVVEQTAVVREIKTPGRDSGKPLLSKPIFERQTDPKKDVLVLKKEQPKPILKDETKKKRPEPVPFLKANAFDQAVDEKKISETIFITKENIEEDLLELKKIDIRTAIIYSEILNRRYV